MLSCAKRIVEQIELYLIDIKHGAMSFFMVENMKRNHFSESHDR